MSETNTLTSISLTGAITWFEVGTPDPEGARAFYGELFGWTFEMDGPYTLVTTGDGHTLRGGIADTRGTPGAVPPYAVPYVQVDDVAGACREAERLGGTVLVPATELPGGLVIGHIADPSGAHIGLWRPPAG